MKLLAIVAIAVIAGMLLLALGAIIAGQAGMLRGQRPADLGAKAGLLAMPKPGALNAVSSQSGEAATSIKPLRFEGDPAAAFSRLADIVQRTPGMTIVTRRSEYLHVEAQTRLLKFTDDVEFLLNPQEGRIDMRSASRLGRRDFDVNRARLEHIRQAFMQEGAVR